MIKPYEICEGIFNPECWGIDSIGWAGTIMVCLIGFMGVWIMFYLNNKKALDAKGDLPAQK